MRFRFVMRGRCSNSSSLICWTLDAPGLDDPSRVVGVPGVVREGIDAAATLIIPAASDVVLTRVRTVDCGGHAWRDFVEQSAATDPTTI